MKILLFCLCSTIGLVSEVSFAAGKRPPKKSAKPVSEEPISVKVDDPKTQEVFVGKSSTKIDFSETAIDGQMKAPDGFFIQGHSANSLSQMVGLRSHFRNELRNSSSAVKSHVK